MPREAARSAGPRLMPCMRGLAPAMASTFLTPSAVSRMAWIRIGLGRRVLGFELGQQLIEVVDVPGPLDLRQHDHVELGAGGRHDLQDVVERPGRVERVDARPQPRLAEVVGLGHGDEAAPGRHLGVGGDGVLEVAQHDVDLGDEVLEAARIFSLCGGTKWIMRSSRTGSCRKGSGAPMASGAKCLAGVRVARHGAVPLLRCNKATL